LAEVGARAPESGTTDGIAAGRPHVFGLAARAIPLSTDGGSLLEQGIDVALLMTPRAEEPFPMRAPRGTLGSGRHFVLRCPGLERERGALARTTAVSELGIQFDLVTAEIVLSRETSQQLRQEAMAQERRATDALRTQVQAQLGSDCGEDADEAAEAAPALERDAHRVRLNQHASASAVELGGVTTIGAEVSMTLLTPVQMDAPIKLAAPRGEIARGVYFALRYFDASGAKRGLLRADSVSARPGMIDAIEATLIRLPTPAEERQSYRTPFESLFTADVLRGADTRTLRGRITDISAGGIGFRSGTPLEAGDRLQIADPSLPSLDGAGLVVVRRDPRDLQRYGARFAQADRGEAIVSTILGLSRAEREHRRRLQIEEVRRSRTATAAPLSDADIRALHNRRMGTRAHQRARGSAGPELAP
jgi:hypothetical protein